jgi:hypothetical protein
MNPLTFSISILRKDPFNHRRRSFRERTVVCMALVFLIVFQIIETF